MKGDIDGVFKNIRVYCGVLIHTPDHLSLIFDRVGICGVLGDHTIRIRRVRLYYLQLQRLFLTQSCSGIAYENFVLMAETC